MLRSGFMSYRRLLGSASFLVFAALVAFGPSACKTSCSDNDADLADEEYFDGITDSSGSVYQSTLWNAPFLEFRPQKKYVFHHGLRGIPNVIQVYVGFTPNPLANANVAEAAGNIAIVERVDENVVKVRNDTCQRFYMRLTASDPWPLSGLGGAGGAGSDVDDATAGASSSEGGTTSGDPAAGGAAGAP